MVQVRNWHLSGNGGRAPAVYGGMRFAVACGLLATVGCATACVVSVDSQGQIVREEKRFTVAAHLSCT